MEDNDDKKLLHSLRIDPNEPENKIEQSLTQSFT